MFLKNFIIFFLDKMSKIIEQEKLDKSKYDEMECVNYEKLSKVPN